MPEKTAPPIERPVARQKMTVEEEVQLYLSNGTRLVWVINPRQRSATIYHSDRTARLLRADDVLDGEDVLPGFTCRLTDIL